MSYSLSELDNKISELSKMMNELYESGNDLEFRKVQGIKTHLVFMKIELEESQRQEKTILKSPSGANSIDNLNTLETQCDTEQESSKKR